MTQTSGTFPALSDGVGTKRKGRKVVTATARQKATLARLAQRVQMPRRGPRGR